MIDARQYMLRFHPNHLSAEIWIKSHCGSIGGANEVNLPSSLLRRGDTVVDIGANIGSTAFEFWSAVGDTGHVFAIEPHPKTFRYLQDNISLNRATNITPLEFAVADRDGELVLTDQTADNLNYITSGDGGLTVVARRLDSLSEITTPIALLKIDVEGFEYAVLQGARDMLKRTESIYFEAKTAHYERFGYGYDTIHNLLTEHGFHIFSQLSPTKITEIGASYLPRKENLIAIRNVDNALRRAGLQIV